MEESHYSNTSDLRNAGASLIVPAAPRHTDAPASERAEDSGRADAARDTSNVVTVEAVALAASLAADRVSILLKRLITWSIWFGSTAIAAVFLVVSVLTITHQSWRLNQSWLIDVAQGHFAAVIGLPFAALASFAIVTVLETTSGPLEFEGLTFKFKGASGPAVLWIACFLSISAAIRALW